MPPGHPGRNQSRAEFGDEVAGGTGGKDEADAKDGMGDGQSSGHRNSSNGGSGSLQCVGRAREVGLGAEDSNAADPTLSGSQGTANVDKTIASPPLPGA